MKPNQTEHPTLSTCWLADVQQMSSEAWSRLVHAFGPVVYRWCRTSGVSESDAPDVVQEVFASVARGIGSFERKKQTGSFRSWLATVTRNRVRDHFRRQEKLVRGEGGTDAMDRLGQHPDQLDSTIHPDDAESPLMRHLLATAQSEFETTTWQAFWSVTVDQKPVRQVAQELALSPASIYQAKSRILRRLRQLHQQLNRW